MKTSERGQGIIEYAFILVLVAVVVIVILEQLGSSVGGVFSEVKCNADPKAIYVCPTPTPQAPASALHVGEGASLNSLSQIQLTSQADENEAFLVPLETLESAAIAQEEKLHQAFSQFAVGLNESLTVLIAEAQAAGDDALAQTLLGYQQELEAGDYNSLPAILTAVNTALASGSSTTQLAVFAAYIGSSLNSCKELARATVSPDLFQAALDALNEQEAASPGSTGSAISLLQQAWDEIIEPRNEVAIGGESGLAAIVTTLLAGLESSQDEAVLQLVQQLNEAGDGCGSLPNMPPVVRTGPDHRVKVNQSVHIIGRWKDPAEDLDEPYTWAWDLNGDGAWDSQGTAAYGPTLVETVSFDQPGTYTLTLMVTDKDGGTDTNSLVVTVRK